MSIVNQVGLTDETKSNFGVICLYIIYTYIYIYRYIYIHIQVYTYTGIYIFIYIYIYIYNIIMLRIAGSILSLFCHVQLYLFDIALQCCLPKDHLKKKLRE